MTEPLLYPRPRRCVFVPGSCAVPPQITVTGAPPGLAESIAGLQARTAEGGWVRCAIDPAAVPETGDEAYRLEVRHEGVVLAARAVSGLRWGLATLAQLRRHYQQALPCLVIDDAPAFVHRGFMLDCARDRVPTMASLRQLIDTMGALKLNHLQLYHEHAFAYVGHEAVWRAADPLTPAEMRELDSYAQTRGVALTANQNSFGHFERWLRHERYRPLGEIDGAIFKADHGKGSWIEPSTLCPLDPGSIALVDDLFRQQFACSSGEFANIGGDEPWELGNGRSRDACARIGRGRVFSEYLAQVVRAAQRHGKRPQYWCDPKPNEDDGMPRDVVALIWCYEHDDDFAIRAQAHVQAGREIWVAPGTSNWCTITSRTWNRRGNLDRAAKEGLAAGARGMLTTEWGDHGHHQQWPLTLFGLADAAQAAWTGGGGYDAAAAGLHLFDSAELGLWLEALGGADEDLCRGLDPATWRRQNGTALFYDLHTPFCQDPNPSELPAWRGIADRLGALETAMPATGGLIERECRHSVQLARYAADRACQRRIANGPLERLPFSERLAPLLAEYRRLWLARSRYGGLEDSCSHFRRLP